MDDFATQIQSDEIIPAEHDIDPAEYDEIFGVRWTSEIISELDMWVDEQWEKALNGNG